FSGITGARMISPGQVVSRNTTLTWLVDLDTVKVEVKVPEKYLGEVKLGRPLEFKVAAYVGQTFRGEVYFISPQLDESTRRALVKVRILNPDLKLKAGMFAESSLTLRLKDDALVIPDPAILSNGDSFMVFIVDEQSKANIRAVKLGERLPGKAEIA